MAVMESSRALATKAVFPSGEQVIPRGQAVQTQEAADVAAEGLTVFERFHVHEQVHKALDRKVWLPSGGHIVIDRTEALTVIDVNTGIWVSESSHICAGVDSYYEYLFKSYVMFGDPELGDIWYQSIAPVNKFYKNIEKMEEYN